MMRIVHLSYARIATSDPEEWLAQLDFFTKDLQTLSRAADVKSVHLIQYTGVIRQKRVEYHFLDVGRWQMVFPFQIHQYVRSLSPDVVIVHGIVFPWQVIWLGLQLPPKTQIAVVHHAEMPQRSVKGWLQKIADRFVQAYFFTANDTAQKWLQSGQIRTKDKIHFVMIGSSVFHSMDRKKARAIVGVRGHPVYIWVGGLNENKDPATLIRAFSKFAKHEYDATLYVVYKDNVLLKEVLCLINDGKSSSSITLVGKVDHEKLLYWLNSADFIISTSHSEGSGIAVGEGMSCGCIPIVTSISSHIAMTAHKQCGLFFSPGSENDLLQVLLKSLNLDIEAESKKVLTIYAERLSSEATVSKMMAVFQHGKGQA